MVGIDHGSGVQCRMLHVLNGPSHITIEETILTNLSVVPVRR